MEKLMDSNQTLKTENMEVRLIVDKLQNELPVEEIKATSYDELKEKWALYFNNLIQNDFVKLVGLFYRIDISEEKVKRMLKENPDEDAGKMITNLVIERLLQKIKSREESLSKPGEFSGDLGAEKW